jgi:hypothetical protein
MGGQQASLQRRVELAAGGLGCLVDAHRVQQLDRQNLGSVLIAR